MSDVKTIVPDGQIYVCAACGKTAKSLMGDQGTRGWDESCMLNAVLCEESSLERGPDGRVFRADAVKP